MLYRRKIVYNSVLYYDIISVQIFQIVHCFEARGQVLPS